jgi:hypothetical protein
MTNTEKWNTRAWDVTLSSGAVRSVYAKTSTEAIRRMQRHLDRTNPNLTAVSAKAFQPESR